MRGSFLKTLVDLAAEDDRIVFLTGDLGYLVVEPFATRFPDRFFNVGVAEQNMVGMATGLAEAGFLPFVYSIATFASLRPYEFIRNGPVLHQLPVRIVAVGGGFEYGAAGPTHHGLEDIGVMRVQPGLTVLAPADARQTVTALRRTYDVPGPVYYRLGKNDKLEVPGLDGRLADDGLDLVRNGKDVLILAMGGAALEAGKAADLLNKEGLNPALGVVSILQPGPSQRLAQLMAEFPLVVTVEAHYVNGGLGSLVAEVLAESGSGSRLIRCGVRTTPDGLSGSQAALMKKHGLDGEGLAATISKATAGRPR